MQNIPIQYLSLGILFINILQLIVTIWKKRSSPPEKAGIFVKEVTTMTPDKDPKDLLGIELSEGEEVSAETVDEFTDNRGDDDVEEDADNE